MNVIRSPGKNNNNNAMQRLLEHKNAQMSAQQLASEFYPDQLLLSWKKFEIILEFPLLGD